MLLIRQRTRKLIIAGIVGAFIVLVPCALFIGALYIKNIEYKKKSTDIEREAALTETNFIYVLSESIAAHEVIENKHIKEVKITGFKPISLNSDIIVGKRAKVSLDKDTILTDDLLYDGEILIDDLRVHNYNYISLPSQLFVDDYIDIRIVFPNGEDFIVAGKKKVLDVNDTGAIYLKVCEEEILRLSSAVVDAYLNEGKIYAIKYVDELQKAAMINYPVNKDVSKLMLNDPNIVKIAENVLVSESRKALEDRLKSDTNKIDNSGYREDNIQEESNNQEYKELEFIE